MLVRRLLLLAAALMLLSALAAGLAPRDRVVQRTRDVPTATSLPAGKTVTKEISAAPGAGAPVNVHRGDILQLQVSGDLLDTVLIERMDRVEAIEPEKQARFEILIDAPAGAYPIRLVEADRRIGTIEIKE
jgi:hypothetical protein